MLTLDEQRRVIWLRFGSLDSMERRWHSATEVKKMTGVSLSNQHKLIKRWLERNCRVISLLCLGVLSTGIAYVLNYQVLGEAGASVASAVTYITPVVAVFVGVLFLGETLTWFEPVGALVVLVGVAMSQGRLRRRKPVKIGDT
jgi:uncharacterized membrane protein